ncbi:MAG: PAS domain S-box protein [Methanomicrobiales archaeon]|nr:PAS domain S-box protein [Methanomicrobiales archaeon]
MAARDKEMELEALRESVAWFRQLVDITPDWVWRTDLEGSHTYSNPAVYPLLGYQVSEIVGTNAFPHIHPGDEPSVRAMLKQCIEQKAGWHNIAIRWLHKDGSIRSFESTANPMLNAHGQITGFSGIDRDITERKLAEETLRKNTGELHAAYEELTASEEGLRSNLVDLTRKEEALRESEQRYRYLFDSAPDGITVVDETGIIVGCNQRTRDITGYTKEELLGKHITSNILLSSSGVFSDKFPLLQQNKPIEGEIRIARKDGGVVWIWRKGFPLPDRAGKFSGALLYDRNITDRKLAEDTLRRVSQKLNVLSQLTRKDLTNQTFVLSSYLELVKNQLAGQDRIIETVEKGVRAVRSIHDIIEYSKDYQDMGAKPPTWQNTKMALLLGLSHIPISEIQHSIETGDLEIFADPLLELVCQRLFENSVKHGDHVTRIRIWHTITPDVATIVFEDDGIGILQERKELIFLRSEGASASMRSLIFVREILDITGIAVIENGEPGKGARFEMTVPKGAWRLSADSNDMQWSKP